MSSPAPYASMLYGHLVDLQAEVASSWRGQGTNDAHATIANIEARIAELEAESGAGMAWTPVDEVRWRGAIRGGLCGSGAGHVLLARRRARPGGHRDALGLQGDAMSELEVFLWDSADSSSPCHTRKRVCAGEASCR